MFIRSLEVYSLQNCLAGTRTTRPSIASETFIWQESRLPSLTSKAKSSMSSSISEGLPVLSRQDFIDIDMARGACTGTPALRLYTGNVVKLGGLHDR